MFRNRASLTSRGRRLLSKKIEIKKRGVGGLLRMSGQKQHLYKRALAARDAFVNEDLNVNSTVVGPTSLTLV